MRQLLIAIAFLAASLPALAAAQPVCDAPQVLLTIDKSSSMLHELPGGSTKWQAARMALGELTASYESRLEFGLQPFPYPDRCGAGEVTMDIGSHDSESLLAGLGDPPPSGGNYTPMAQTLDRAGAYAPLTDPDRDNHLILITDGWQWCDPYDPATRFDPVESVEALAGMGITVHVVGFGAAVDSLTLNRAAVAAGTALPGCDPMADEPSDPNHCYMQVSDLGELRSALDDIGRHITDEVCDGYDNDCDGTVDEGYDRDGDGYTTCGTVWDDPGSTDTDRADCDDEKAAVHPGAEELCDGLDNDCDGTVDPGCDCTDGETRPCGSSIGACSEGTQSCSSGGWGSCEGAVEAADTDMCDGADEDCDGSVDEDAACGPGRACKDGSCVDLTPADAGMDAPAPETPADAGAPGDAGPAMTPETEGGCGCATVGAPRGRTVPVALAGLLALVAFIVVRRWR